MIKIGFDCSNYPCTYISNGFASGIEYHYVKNILEKSGFECKFIPLDWNVIFKSLSLDEVDFIFSSISMTADRSKYLIGTIPYFNTPEILLEFSVGALSNDSIGVLHGSNHERYAKTVIKKSNIVQFNSYAEIKQSMLDGSVSSCLVDWFNGNDIAISIKGKKEILAPIYITDAEWFGSGSCIISKSKNKKNIEKINETIRNVGVMRIQCNNQQNFTCQKP